MKSNRWLLLLITVVAFGSFLLGAWPLAAAAVAAVAFVGRGFLALPLGFLFDLAYGAPVGLASYLIFPFALVGLVALAGRYAAERYFLNRASRDTL